MAFYYRMYARGMARLSLLDASEPAYRSSIEAYRELVADEPHVYAEILAETLDNLSCAQADARRPDDAVKTLTEVLDIQRRLLPHMRRNPRGLVTALGHMAVSLRALHEYELAGRHYLEAIVWSEHTEFDEAGAAELIRLQLNYANLNAILDDEFTAWQNRVAAVEKARGLVAARPNAWDTLLANALSAVALSQRSMQKLSDARSSLSQAVEIFRARFIAQPLFYAADFAKTLDKYGVILLEEGAYEQSGEALREAVSLFRQLAAAQPKVYGHALSQSLTNAGALHVRLKKMDAATALFEEALTISEHHATPADTAHAYLCLGGVAESRSDEQGAVNFYTKAIEHIELATLKVIETEHRDKLKRDVQHAYDRVIGFHARDLPANPEHFIRLLESQRHIEALAFDQGRPTIEDRDALISAIKHGDVSRAGRLADRNAGFMWVHIAGDVAVFALLSCAGLEITRQPAESLSSLFALASTLKDWSEDPYSGQHQLQIRSLGNQAFGSLATQVQEFLRNREIVFVSTCRQTLLLPLELMIDNGLWLGLTKLLVRSSGLTHTSQLLKRSPIGNAALLVGDPRHDSAAPLPGSMRSVVTTARRLRRSKWRTTLLTRKRATRAALRMALKTGDVALWVYSGHGDLVSLNLAGTDHFMSFEHEFLDFNCAPVVHFEPPSSTRGSTRPCFQAIVTMLAPPSWQPEGSLARVSRRIRSRGPQQCCGAIRGRGSRSQIQSELVGLGLKTSS
jgi:tetratricopeptide (TPR) repeat protein